MFKLALAQCCHPSDGDVVGMVESWMRRAKDAGADMLAFPESLMTPYELAPVDFAAASEPIDGPFCTAVNELAARYGLWTVYTANESGAVGQGAPVAHDTPENGAAGHAGPAAYDANRKCCALETMDSPAHCNIASPEGDAGGSRRDSGEKTRPLTPPYNTAVVVDDRGEVRGTYRKVHLFDTDFTRESDKVAAGVKLFTPIDTPFGRIGLGICYDVRFPELARAAALDGCDVLVLPAAWVDGPRKVEQWRTLLAARAIENEMFVAGLSRCDRGFGRDRRDYAGHSCVFGPRGEEVASLAYGEALLVADIDLAAIAETRAAMPVLSHRRPSLYA